MSILDKETGKYLCECGCGEEVVDPLSEFRAGHHMRTAEHRLRASEQAYEQNIGTYKGSYSEERRRAMSEGQLRSYREDPTRAKRVSESLRVRTW